MGQFLLKLFNHIKYVAQLEGIGSFQGANIRSGCHGREEVMTGYVHIAVLDARCLCLVLKLS